MKAISAIIDYNIMSEEELNASYKALKAWLHKEYADEVNAALMLQNYTAKFPVDLQDGMNYAIDLDYNLICYGLQEEVVTDMETSTLLFSKLTIIADRIVGNVNTVFGRTAEFYAPFCTAIESIQGLRGMLNIDDLAVVNMPLLNIAPSYFFQGLKLKKVILPSLKTIKKNSFEMTTVEEPLIFPKLINIEEKAFRFATITDIDIPSCRCISDGAFEYCSNLQRLGLGSNVITTSKDTFFDNINTIYIAGSALSGAGLAVPSKERQTLLSLTVLDYYITDIHKWNIVKELKFPNCGHLYAYQIEKCANLERLELPKCTTLQQNAITECDSLQEITVPEALHYIGNANLVNLGKKCNIVYV